MKIDLRPELRALSPVTLQEQLRSRGWQEQEATPFVVVYRRGTDELDVPLRADFADYARRVEELLEVLAELEGVRPTELLESLVQPEGDTLALRVESPVTETGTIPLDDSLRIRHGMKVMVLAAAHSALSPQPWFARLTQKDPMALLAGVREGQSQRGSFTMRCIVPVSPPVGQLGLANVQSDREPYGRTVMRLLLGALESVQQVRSRGDRDGLLRLCDQGVSGNLLAALATMSPPGGSGGVEVSVSWARNRPAPKGSSRVHFPSQAFDGLMEAALAMRDRVKAKGFEVTGYVTRLEQAAPAAVRGARKVGAKNQHLQSGDVIIAPTEGDAQELGNVSVRLSHQDYQEAIEAHRTGARVHVVGTLEKTGRRWTLSDPTGFERCADASDV